LTCLLIIVGLEVNRCSIYINYITAMCELSKL